MYHLVKGLYEDWTRKPRYNILLIGLSGVGKSCLIEKIKSLYLKRPTQPPSRIVPTVGQNVLDLNLPSLDLHFWDLGGSKSVRTLWSRYYDESDAVVWVVDATDFADILQQQKGQGSHSTSKPGAGSKGKGKAETSDLESDRAKRREESWSILSDLLMHPSLESLPILIVANKVDQGWSSSSATQGDGDGMGMRTLSREELQCGTETIRRWFAEKMATMGEEDHQSKSSETASSKVTKLTGDANPKTNNIFADDEDQYNPVSNLKDLEDTRSTKMPGSFHSRHTLHSNEYEWDVVATSAIDGTGVHEMVDWITVRVQAARKDNGRP